jgi:Na+-transporting methylmalonyl-CoA/oxaloacetate decarboxylase beta subunit
MKILFPVAAAFMATFAIGLLLSPLVYLMFSNFFELNLFGNPSPDAARNKLIIQITLMLWLFISSLAGGYICSLLAETKEWLAILLFFALIFLISVFISMGLVVTEFQDSFWVFISSFITGAGIGAFIAIKRKKKEAAI